MIYTRLSLVQKISGAFGTVEYYWGVARGCGTRGAVRPVLSWSTPTVHQYQLAQQKSGTWHTCACPLLIFRFCCDEHTIMVWY